LVIHRRQQVHRAAVTACRTGAAQPLAVDGNGRHRLAAGPRRSRSASQAPIAPARASASRASKRPADGDLGRDGEVAGGVVAGAECGEDRLGRVGGPFADRGDRPRPGQHRSGRQAQDRDQWVAAASAARGSGTLAR
jgi:hypothetical protein